MRPLLITAILCLGATAQVVVAPPAMPQAGYNTQADLGVPASFATYNTTIITDSGNPGTNAANLQAAVNTAATCTTGAAGAGWIIYLSPGVVYEPASGQITFPANQCGAGQWIVIESDAAPSALPAAGTRIAPAFAADLPIIMEGQVNPSAFYVDPGANNYLFRFLSFELDPVALNGKDSSGSFIAIGDGTYGAGCTVCNPSQQPTNIVVDRDLLRGSDSPPIGFRRGVAMSCSRCAVVNSWIDQIHEAGFDAQAICGWNSTGPWLVDNNYLEGAAENILVGGAPSNMGQNPSDLTITRNFFYKPMSWDGSTWSIKNLLEFKSGVRVLVEGNVFQNCWTSGQSGRAIAINTTDSAGGAENPWLTVSDLTVAFNRFDNTQGFIEPGDVIDGTTGVAPARIAVRDNLATNQGGGSGFLLLGLSDSSAGQTGQTSDVLTDHNTVLLSLATPAQPSSSFELEGSVSAGETPLPNFAFNNNIFEVGRNGTHQSCSVNGVGANCTAAAAWLKNIAYDTTTAMCGAGNQSYAYAANTAACPIANWQAIGFYNAPRGQFALTPASAGHGAATDGGDVGVNMLLLQSMLWTPTGAPVAPLTCTAVGAGIAACAANP